jgi:hypothetical protein
MCGYECNELVLHSHIEQFGEDRVGGVANWMQLKVGKNGEIED